MIRRAFAFAALVLALVPLLANEAIPLKDQPFPDAAEYADGAYQIANGNGFRTRIDETAPPDQQAQHGELKPSRYPPGFSLVLAPWVRVGHNTPSDAQRGARAVAVLLLFALFAAAWALGGPVAAGVAALVTMWSPFTEESSRLVMSDALGAALTMIVLAVVAIAWSEGLRDRVRTALFAAGGALAGYGVLVRLSAVAVLGSLLVTTQRWKYFRAVALGTLPLLIFLGAYQWTEFGSPVRTGYDYWPSHGQEFSANYVTEEAPRGERGFIHADKLDGALMRWTCPCDQYGPIGKASNLVFYPAVLLGMYWIYFPPLFSLLGVWELFRRRRTAAAQFGALVIVTNLLLFIPYFYQGGRLVASGAFVLLVFAAVAVARIAEVAGSGLARRIAARRDEVAPNLVGALRA